MGYQERQGNRIMYEYRCIIVEVVDGDTIDIDIDLGFGVWMRGERIRLDGVDTPESRTSDAVEKKFGLLAKHFVEEKLPVGKEAVLLSKQFRGKFGRILGDIRVDGKILTEELISNHLAVPYHGENKGTLSAAHQENRKILMEQGKIL